MLISCPHCRTTISNYREHCPHCSFETKTKQKLTLLGRFSNIISSNEYFISFYSALKTEKNTK